MSSDYKAVLKEWELDLEFNKANGQLTKEGEFWAAAIQKAIDLGLYSLSESELKAIETMSGYVLKPGDRSKADMTTSLVEQGVPLQKIPEIIEQTKRVYKEAKLINDAISKVLTNRNKKECNDDG
jgi:hypothetical protein